MASASSLAATTLPCSSCPWILLLPPNSRISLLCRFNERRGRPPSLERWSNDWRRSTLTRLTTLSVRASGRSDDSSWSSPSQSRCCCAHRSYFSCHTSAARCTLSNRRRTSSGSECSSPSLLTIFSAASTAAFGPMKASRSSLAIMRGSRTDAWRGSSRVAASGRWKCQMSSRLMASALPCSSCSVLRRGCACPGENVSLK
mmetsp:Transcript_2532/g.6275  ORF Transcript_2532/g.6275 Transcript_2532/m.6275 type:complete len:201 (+) Transcript_2532:2923-3525(+)